MEVTAVIGIGIVTTVMALVLKSYQPEYKLLLSLGAGVVMLLIIISSITPVLEQLTQMFEYTQMPKSYIGILIKALGICFLTQLAGDVCKDAGEASVAAKIELAGKVAVLVLSLPLFAEILAVAGALIKL